MRERKEERNRDHIITMAPSCSNESGVGLMSNKHINAVNKQLRIRRFHLKNRPIKQIILSRQNIMNDCSTRPRFEIYSIIDI